MRHIISIFIVFLSCFSATARASSPKLVVNIVVSQMRYDYIERFADNFSDGGFRRFMDEGMVFTNARYNYMQTISPAGLATITTGAEPSTHGIVSERWIDYTTNTPVSLITDYSAHGLGCDAGRGNYSRQYIVVPTVADRLYEKNHNSKVVTVAANPVSAVVMGGQNSLVYWLDESRGCWSSSTAYMENLPLWVQDYNSKRVAQDWMDYRWRLSLPKDRYKNKNYSVVDFTADNSFKRLFALLDITRNRGIDRDYAKLLFLPVGNTLVADFARQAIRNEKLGQDEHTDILNICFDTSRYIGSVYGGESVEVEDMFYKLDQELAALLYDIEQSVNMKDVVIVLTSDHGASDSFDYGRKPRDLFNTSQFKVIVNGFMNAQYGPGEWVSDYCDRQLYFNRNLIYTNGLSLMEVQNKVAAFALQFRGVSHVLTSTAMQMSYFSGSYAEMMQNSFYPRHSGDITINLMPGWIEEKEGIRSGSGSMYEYDTHVPLMLLGPKFHGQTVLRTVNMRDVAPTLSHIIGIGRPIAAEGEAIEEIIKLY